MFQKNSFSVPSDSSGILLVKVIQTRKCNTTRHAKEGRFLRVVVRNTKTSLNKIKKKKQSYCGTKLSPNKYTKRKIFLFSR